MFANVECKPSHHIYEFTTSQISIKHFDQKTSLVKVLMCFLVTIEVGRKKTKCNGQNRHPNIPWGLNVMTKKSGASQGEISVISHSMCDCVHL